MRKGNIRPIESILLIRFSSLGDIILTTGVIDTLKAELPDADIFFLTKERYKGLFAGDDRLSSVITLGAGESFRSLIQKLRNHRFDAILDLHSVVRSYATGWFLSGPVVRLKKRPITRRIMTLAGRQWVNDLSVTETHREIMERLGIKRLHSPWLVPSREGMIWARGWLTENNLKKRGYAVIAAGARHPTKRWTEDGFAEVSDWLIAKKGLPVLFLGDRNDVPFIGSIIQRMKNTPHDLSGQTSLENAVSILALARLLITNDSGLMQMGCALGIPLGAVFGPTHPSLGFLEEGPGRAIFTTNEPCSPCSPHGKKPCKKMQRKCMENITAHQVMEGINSLLEVPLPLLKPESIPQEDVG